MQGLFSARMPHIEWQMQSEMTVVVHAPGALSWCRCFQLMGVTSSQSIEPVVQQIPGHARPFPLPEPADFSSCICCKCFSVVVSTMRGGGVLARLSPAWEVDLLGLKL